MHLPPPSVTSPTSGSRATLALLPVAMVVSVFPAPVIVSDIAGAFLALNAGSWIVWLMADTV